jgi:uncharacterized protein (TIGR02246 family)
MRLILLEITMPKRFILIGLALSLFLSCQGATNSQPPQEPQVQQRQAAATEQATEQTTEQAFVIPEEERPFWESAQAFLDAFSNRDSAAIGELFTPDAEFLDEFGELTVGRENIVAMFQEVFDTAAESRVEEILIERVRRISDTVALEDGYVVSTDVSGGPRFTSRYVALHSKGTDDVWRINTLKDFPRNLGERQEQLSQLAWMLGEWFNEDSESKVHTECDWSEDGNYLMRRFTTVLHDGREMSGVQRIGWDAAMKKIRSWTFDSEGGVLDGVWTHEGGRWHVATTGTTASGESVSATAIYTVIDAEMVQWQYRNLIIGDEVVAEPPPITMVRRPPLPGDASN